MPLVIALDFDGTLTPTGGDYDRAHLRGALMILETLGRRAPPRKRLFAKHEEIDTRLIQDLQFQVRRVPTSWVETYAYFAEESGVGFDRRVGRAIYRQTSRAIRRGPYELYDHVQPTLELLRADGHELHLLTMGEERHQMHKIHAVKIESFFHDRIHVVALDKRDVMRRIFAGRELQSVMVGDSRRADIAAALEVGAHAVWATYGSPSRHHDGPIEGSFLEIKSFSELPAVLLQLSHV